MTKKIEAGMLVKIVSCENPRQAHHVGHVGRVIGPCSVWPDGWDIEGAERTDTGKLCSFHSDHLEPIDPPEEEATWEAVEKLTGWNPSRQKEIQVG